jgi:hypothetical protein
MGDWDRSSARMVMATREAYHQMLSVFSLTFGARLVQLVVAVVAWG